MDWYDYDSYGKIAANQQPGFLLPNQILAMKAVNHSTSADVVVYFKISAVDLTDTAEANLQVL